MPRKASACPFSFSYFCLTKLLTANIHYVKHKSMVKKNKSSTSATNTRGAQPEGRSLADCISWRIQYHVMALTQERQGQSELLLLQWTNQKVRSFPQSQPHCSASPLPQMRQDL